MPVRSLPRGTMARTGGVPLAPWGGAVAIGRLSAPANTVTWPSRSMRTAILAPTRLRLSARTWPLNRAVPESPTSALGALATTVPSASRTTMSRSRKVGRPFSSRSIWVPPTSTVWPPPKFCSIAFFSHGVATSTSIGPCASRHHRPAAPSTASTAAAVAPSMSRLTQRRRSTASTPRPVRAPWRPAQRRPASMVPATPDSPWRRVLAFRVLASRVLASRLLANALPARPPPVSFVSCLSCRGRRVDGCWGWCGWWGCWGWCAPG